MSSTDEDCGLRRPFSGGEGAAVTRPPQFGALFSSSMMMISLGIPLETLGGEGEEGGGLLLLVDVLV